MLAIPPMLIFYRERVGKPINISTIHLKCKVRKNYPKKAEHHQKLLLMSFPMNAHDVNF
jgi:hypothetical protein